MTCGSPATSILLRHFSVSNFSVRYDRRRASSAPP
jgi:hypothetical protein